MFHNIAGLAAQCFEKIHHMPGESGLIYRERVSCSLRHEKGSIGLHQYSIQPERSRRILYTS